MKNTTAVYMTYDKDKTFSNFFKIHFYVLKDLFAEYRLSTLILLIVSIIELFGTVIELKFVEYTTNAVDMFFKGTLELTSLVFSITLFLLSILVVTIIGNCGQIIALKFKSKLKYDITCKITCKLSEIPYEFYEYSQFHDNIRRARLASDAYPEMLSGLILIIKTFFQVIIYGVLLSKVNSVYLIVIAIVIVLNVFISSKISEKRFVNWIKNLSPNERRSSYFANIMDNRINHLNIQATRNYPYFANSYQKYNDSSRRAAIRESVLSFIGDETTSLMFAVVFFATIVFVAHGVVNGALTIGFFTMILTLLINMFSSVRQFGDCVINSDDNIKTVCSYYQIMEICICQECDNSLSETSEPIVYVNGLIYVDDLKYKYPQADKYALDGITVSFKKGEKIAIVGDNGSGKTTLMSVFLGLLNNYEGRLIKSNLTISALMQDFINYQMTIKENIELGCGGKTISDEKAIDLLKKVGLLDYITSLPNGINTSLGHIDENGTELSKGQYQRLAIARLLANESANVWILDEPTAYLDPIAEIETYKLIFNLAGDRLVFFISHRLGFAKYADRILVIDEGHIVEDGTHDELINNNKTYKKMYEAQSKLYE